MKKLSTTFLLLACMLLPACGGDDNGGSADDGNKGSGTLTELTPARGLAFPGAAGGASTITGGAGQDVYIVTNLNDDGEGSLRKGVRMNKSMVVFAVAGQINLESDLEITASNITVAGQTAPGDGITIAGYPVFIKGNNVILRFLRFRMGNQNLGKANFNADNSDALSVSGDYNNIIIDHCSVSYSTDECASFTKVENFTLQYCIISESLRKGHSKVVDENDSHGYGGIWGGRNATYHHNLLASHDSRNPRFSHHYVGGRFHGPIDYINNVVYNWGGNSTYGGEANNESNIFHINMIGNYYKSGPSTNKRATNRLMQLTSICTNCVEGTGIAFPAKIYIEGNTVNGQQASWDNIVQDSKETRDSKSMAKMDGRWTAGLTPVSFQESAQDAYTTVLDYAGASMKRDRVDKRIVSEVREGTGSLLDEVASKINDEDYFPTLATGTPIIDTDKDGMPDSWETQQMAALGVTGKPVSEFKPNAYNITAKYTNLEVYINSLVTKTFPAGANASAIK